MNENPVRARPASLTSRFLTGLNISGTTTGESIRSRKASVTTGEAWPPVPVAVADIVPENTPPACPARA